MERIEYEREIHSLAKHIAEEAAEYDRDVSDVLHETIDGHKWVIYTAYNFDVLKWSENDNYAEHEFGPGAVRDERGMRWDSMAYWAMHADVQNALAELADV